MAPLRHEFAPITDFPEHAATIATVLDVMRSGPLATWYELGFLHTQYWLMAVLGALLAPLVGGPVTALKLLLMAASVGLVASVMRLCWRLGLDEWLALFTVPLVWSRPFTLGFIPFLLAAPLVVLAVTEVARPQQASRHHALVAALGLGTFFLNIASVLWLLVSAVAVAAVMERRNLAALVRRAAGALVLLLPLAAWAVLGNVVSVDASRFAVSLTPRWWSPRHVLLEAPEWLTDRWLAANDLDRWVLWLMVLALGLLALPVGARTAARRGPAIAFAAATLGLVLALPFERGWLWGLSMRFLPLGLSLAPLALARATGALRHVSLVLVVCATTLSLFVTEQAVTAAQAELEGCSILRGLPADSRVLQLSFDDASAVARDALTSHASAYHRVWNGGANEPSFVDLPQSVVHYRPGRAPWMRPWPWEFAPADYDNAREGPHHDFVLVRGNGPSFPPPPGSPGPPWVELRSHGAFRLFARQ